MMRIALMEASQKSIDMQYFSTREDTTGKLLLEAVTRAADRGVRVRLLLDDRELEDFEAGAVSLNQHPNIEIRVFNPYSTQDESFFAHVGNVFSDIARIKAIGVPASEAAFSAKVKKIDPEPFSCRHYRCWPLPTL
jgi:phosphatidylserine/phosphatidylglycerophosphate/cardiolipin synthase-like enzyme